MNLEEFRKALSSDATEENAQLKRQLSDLQIDALLLREVLLVYFVVSITPALICRGLRNRWLWLIN